jgi:hypothetical protein
MDPQDPYAGIGVEETQADPYAGIGIAEPQADPYAGIGVAESADPYASVAAPHSQPPKRLAAPDPEYPVESVAIARDPAELAKLDKAQLAVFGSHSRELLRSLEEKGKLASDFFAGGAMADPTDKGAQRLYFEMGMRPGDTSSNPEVSRALALQDKGSAVFDAKREPDAMEFGPLTEAYRVKDGRIEIDPYRFKAGVKQAVDAKALSPEQAATLDKTATEAEAAVKERVQLLEDAGKDPKTKALLLGAGRGALMLAGAKGGAMLGSRVPGPGPVKAVGAFAGGVGGALLTSAAERALEKRIEKHSETLRSLTASGALEPRIAQGGELAAFVVTAPVSLAKLADATRMVAADSGKAAAAGFVAKQVGKAAAIGAGTDTLVQGGMMLADGQPEFSKEQLGISTAISALLAGHGVKFRDYNPAQVEDIVKRGIVMERAQSAADGVLPAGVRPLSDAEGLVYRQAVNALDDLAAQGKVPAELEQTARQMMSFERPITSVETSAKARSAGGLPAEAASSTPTPPASQPATQGRPIVQASGGVTSGPVVVPKGGIVEGAETVVFGARNTELPARYIWARTSETETSHVGEMMGPNPNYPLKNSRDYTSNTEEARAERDKQLATRNEFDPRQHVTDSPSASNGPSMSALVINEKGDEARIRLGGNNRGWAIANLAPDKRAALRELENAKAGNYGLAPTDDPDAELQRDLGTFDMRIPGEVEKLQEIIHILNPSPGQVQANAVLAEQNAKFIPPDALAGMDMTIGPNDAQAWLKGTIETGQSDRSLVAGIASNGTHAQDYTLRLLSHVAFNNPSLTEARMDARSAGTITRAWLDAAVPPLVRMRALGPDGVTAADAVSRTFNTIFRTGAKTMKDALDIAARQTEFDPASIVSRVIAQGLQTALVADAKGKPVVEASAANAGTLFRLIDRTVREWQKGQAYGGGDLLTASEKTDTVADAILRAVAHFTDKGLASASEGGGKPKMNERARMEGESDQEYNKRLAALNGIQKLTAEQEAQQQNDARRNSKRAKNAAFIGKLEDEITGQRSLFNNDSPLSYAVSGSAYADVPLAGLPNVKIVEMPELVQMVREMTGQDIELRNMPKALGQFLGLGKGLVRLNPRIFQDYVLATKVLAHEIGHLIDYLPQATLKRGNLWGRLHSLRSYMKGRWTPTGPTDKELRAELIALSEHWKPIDRTTAPASYIKYRESGVELYADFISVLFNSPATAKQIAPKFYRNFFQGLLSKPDIKRDLFELQAWLNQPFATRQDARRVRVDEMMALGEEVFLRKMEERKVRYAGFRGFASRLKQGFFDIYSPIRDRANEAGDTAAARQVTELFDSHPFSRNENWRWLERMHRTVIEPLEAAGFTMDDMGAHLFFDRVANESYGLSERQAKELGVETGGRSVIPNPQGHPPKTARDALTAERLRNGMKRQTLLEFAVQKFHDEVFDVMQEAAKVGLLTPEQMKLIATNRDHYAAFVPLEYVDTFVPAGIHSQSGTLKDIGSPFLSTVLKVLTFQRAIQFQKLKAATVDLMMQSFSHEIRPAETRKSAGGGTVAVPPRDKGQTQLSLRVNGQMAWFNVPKEIGLMFEYAPAPLIESAMELLGKPFRSMLYPIFITFNPIFQMVTNPIRDVRRTLTNRPMSIGWGSILRQLPLIKHIGRNPALDDVRLLIQKGEQAPMIAEMIDNLAITPGEATFSATAGVPTKGWDKLMQDHGLLPADEQSKWYPTRWPVIGRVFSAIQTAGRMNELLLKRTVYAKVRMQGWKPNEAATMVRNVIGTPHFGRRGKHANIPNSIFPFFNIWTKGWAADAKMAAKGYRRASRPDAPETSAAAWWMRWAMMSAVPRMLVIGGGLGLMGKAIKNLLDGIGDHDKANYDVIPIGYEGASEVNADGKTVYIRIPKDPTDRLVSGIFGNILTAAAVKAAKAGVFGQDIADMNADRTPSLSGMMAGNIGIVDSDVPGLNPLIKTASAWKDYLAGQNPVDSFRNRSILSEDEHLAGGWEGTKSMLAWTYGQTGAQSFIRYNPQSDTTTEILIDNTPLINGLFKVSDYGHRQTQEDGQAADRLPKAEERLALPADVQKIRQEFTYLQSLGAKFRTPPQSARMESLKTWDKAVYKISMEQLLQTEDTATKAAIRRQMEESSKPFIKGANP